MLPARMLLVEAYHVALVAMLLFGIVLALMHYPRHPAVSWRVLVACCIFLSFAMLEFVTGAVGREILRGFDLMRPLTQIRFGLGYNLVAKPVLTIIAYGLLFVAAFGWRNQQPSKPPVGEQR